MQKSRLLKIDCVNRIKLEKVNEFNKSIFHDVYEKAITLTSKIINDTIRIKSEINNNNSSYLDGERLNNIIPFLGERGMGKSSAMLSFANYLENYEEEKNDDYSLSIEKKCSKPSFLVLPQIDIAMLVKGENLLDIILSDTEMITTDMSSDVECIISFKKTVEAVDRLTTNDKIVYFSRRDIYEYNCCGQR